MKLFVVIPRFKKRKTIEAVVFTEAVHDDVSRTQDFLPGSRALDRTQA
jgi:hypothetical protein